MKEKQLPLRCYPRERLIDYGAEALSDQELLAILLRTGSHPLTVMELSAAILHEFDNLYEFKDATLDEFQQVRGVGQIKAIELTAMVELGGRIQRALQPKFGKVNSSIDLGMHLVSELKDQRQEQLLCFFLNTKNEIIKKKKLFIGSLNQSVNNSKY